jgi:hypothetical protein
MFVNWTLLILNAKQQLVDIDTCLINLWTILGLSVWGA